jgi:hypothetical protein
LFVSSSLWTTHIGARHPEFGKITFEQRRAVDQKYGTTVIVVCCNTPDNSDWGELGKRIPNGRVYNQQQLVSISAAGPLRTVVTILLQFEIRFSNQW